MFWPTKQLSGFQEWLLHVVVLYLISLVICFVNQSMYFISDLMLDILTITSLPLVCKLECAMLS
jgi:hypothetical protein